MRKNNMISVMKSFEMTAKWQSSGVNFSSDAHLRLAVFFAGFLRCQFSKKNAREYSGKSERFLMQISCKIAEHFFLGETNSLSSHLRNPAEKGESQRCA